MELAEELAPEVVWESDVDPFEDHFSFDLSKLLNGCGKPLHAMESVLSGVFCVG